MPYYIQPDAIGIPQNNNTSIHIYLQPCFHSNQITTVFFTGQPMLQHQKTYYDGVTDMNYYGSQYNNNNRVTPQPVNTQNYVLNSLVDAITTAIRSNVPDPYLINTPEVKEYIQQVIVTVEIVFKNQVRGKNVSNVNFSIFLIDCIPLLIFRET